MRRSPVQSIPDVCEVTEVGGEAAGGPDLLLEVPHGATLAAHFAALRRVLRGRYPDELQEFFFVNTDVGAPEVALAAAREVVAAAPGRSALVLRSLVPRTFVDCNRVIEEQARPQASAKGEVTPGVHAWVRDAADLALLLGRYRAYRAAATAAFEAVCGRGGIALMVHSYAPRSVDVPVDERIVERLRAAYASDRVGTWPLRSPVDLITHDPEGRLLASAALMAAATAAFGRAGLAVANNGAYSLHPSTLAHGFSTRYPGQTLCLEVRRDLLVPEFTPFREMRADARKVQRVARALAEAVLAQGGSPARPEDRCC